MSPLPTNFRDRWQSRKEAEPGQGTIYWHVLMNGHPEVSDLARQVRKRISGFPGFHITPDKWLHATILIAGTTSEISRDRMSAMLHHASQTLEDVSPMSVTLGRVLYHPEAIMLGISPERALDPIREAVQASTCEVIGSTGQVRNASGIWNPHVTVAYSTAEQPAGPIISKLGKDLPPRAVRIAAVSLVVQWGPERLWDWEPVGAIRLNDQER
ncbi:2'-5' RNA ligase family protein [Actinoallomurus sp. NPDC052308]|uniref:2'-5' RNA ligase family protein n=1 Tax=Actinoallomurus sp. NPDC052308 TaxID=3155530 RepID=UPI0034450EAA